MYQNHDVLVRKTHDGCTEQVPYRLPLHSDEGLIVEVNKETIEDLTVHAVSHPTVAWNAVSKVFDLESSLETRGEEAPERCYQRREGTEDHEM